MSPLYLFNCDHCDRDFEALRPIEFREATDCPVCGGKSSRVFTPIPFSFGWRLSDASHIRGNKDELVKDV